MVKESTTARLPPDLIARVDAWAASHPAKVTRSAAIVALLGMALDSLKVEQPKETGRPSRAARGQR